jgi:hypothetical protein
MAVLLNILKTKHMKHNRIDRSIFLDIEEKFAELKIINGLAKHYNVDNATIKKVLIEFGLDPDYYKKQEEQIKENAVRYYCDGHTILECCKKFNLTYAKLIILLRKRGLERIQTKVTCEICKESVNNLSFSKHIKYKHKLKSKDYYDTFCKKPTEGKCGACNKETPYVNTNVGYKPHCSRSCATKEFRQRLKNDPIKHKQFTQKVSNNASRMHANLTAEEKALRIQKSSNTNKANIALMTPEERKQKFGWMNKLTEKEKNEFIQNVMTNTGCHLWRKTSTDEEKAEVFRKRGDAILQKNANRLPFEAFATYRQIVTFLTEKTYKKFKQEINPHNLRRRVGSSSYHLDHKYSVFQGFVDGVLPEIIACKHNLQMLLGSENMAKGAKCHITLEHLISLYEKE